MIDQQELFNHMADQHGLTLLQGEMDAIIHLVVQGLKREGNMSATEVYEAHASAEVFAKDKDGVLRETTLKALVSGSLHKSGIDADCGQLNDGSASWISIKKENDQSEIIDTNLLFSKDGRRMTGVKVYCTPVKRVVDEANTKCLI